jgi:DNA-directed RNA polymerase subunit K/omega
MALEEPLGTSNHDQSDWNPRAGPRISKRREQVMVTRPVQMNAYEFVAVAALRAQQLLGGCTPRLAGEHSPTTMAQMEVAAGQVARTTDPSAPTQCGWQR